MLEEAKLLIDAIGLLAILGGVWKIAHISATVDEIKTNELPHIYDELRHMAGRIDELQKLL